MYYDTRDRQGFLASELIGVRAARDSAVSLSLRAESSWIKSEASEDQLRREGNESDLESAILSTHASRENYRVSHREACKLKDEVAGIEYDLGIDGYEDSDMDEYGYAA